MKSIASFVFLTCAVVWLGLGTALAQTTDTITGLSTSANPSCFGQAITFTAVVTSIPSGTGIPTGTVTFSDGTAVIATETLDTSGQASFSTASLAAGAHAITAQYSGDANFNPSTSAIVTATINTGPAITEQPASQAVCVGSVVTFTAAASGSPTPALQWQASADGGTTFANITGATGGTYSFTVSLTDNGKQYRAQFVNMCGTEFSAAATLAVAATPTATVIGGKTICAGSRAAVQASLTGTPPWTLVWSDGVTNNYVWNSLFTRLVGPPSTTTYTVTYIADASCTGTASGSATITVNSLPVVTANPTNRTVCAGNSASFTATATGSPAPAIQWQVSTDGGATFQNAANATNTTYTFVVSGSDDSKQFRALFSNTCGVVSSAAAALTVNALPICSVSGADAVCASSVNNLYTGPAGLSGYRWSVTGSATLSGANNAASVSVNAGTSGTFTLTLVVTNLSGCTSTCSKTVTNWTLPTAVVSGGGAICPGNSTTIQAALGGTGPWTLVWSDGFTQANVSTSPATRTVSPSTTTSYTVITVTGPTCSNSGSGSAPVTVNAAPVVTGNPATKTVCAGSSVSFVASASGSPAPGAQWQVSLDGGATFTSAAGATSSTYTFTPSLSDSGKSFRVLFTNACGSALSSPASLVVNALPSAVITADPVVCAGSTGNIASVPSAGAGATYAWTVSGGTITSGAGTSGITYTAGGSGAISISVSVTTPQGCSASSSQSVAFASQGKNLEGWKNKAPLQWQGSTFNVGDHQYSEGNTIPMRLELAQMCAGVSWCVVLRYDFKDGNTSRHFYDFLSTYNSSEPTVNGQACNNLNCSGVPTTFPIPADATLSYQLPGNFTVYNGAITNVSTYTTVTGSTVEKQLIISGVTASGGGAKDVLILFGGHLARENEWGAGNGASSFPGASAKVFYQFCGESSFGNFGVNPAGIIKQADLSITKSASPNPLCAGSTLTYSLVVANSGPNQASPVTVLDWLPAGTTPNSISLSQGTYSGTTNLSFALGTINAGSNATITIVVDVNTNTALGTITNTASVSAGAPADPYMLNNTATATTMVFPVPTATPLSDQVVCAGAPATFSTVAIGAPPFTYQWTHNGSYLLGATNSSYTIPAVSASDTGTYCVIVVGHCNGASGVVTNCASLAIGPNTATSPLVDLVRCPGENAIFSTTPSGTGPFSFVWKKDGVAIPGATLNTLTLTSLAATNSGAYCVEVTGGCSTVSTCAMLTVRPDTTATALVSQSKCVGESATFTTVASGTGPFTYVWRKDGVVLPGQTLNSLTVTSVSTAQAGSYCVEVRGNCGSFTNCADLTIRPPTTAEPLISQTNCPGTTASFSTTAHGDGPFTYQWIKNGAPLMGQTASSLTLPNLTAADAGTYSVQVNGLCGGTTNSATLTINQNAFVANPPLSLTNCPGTSATFSVTAGGTGPFSYQWLKNGLVLSGETNSNLILPVVSAADAATYTVVVTGACGNSVSSDAVLVLNSNVALVRSPVDLTNCPGGSATFATLVRGTGPFSYQWFKAGNPLTGQTYRSLTLGPLSTEDAGTYSVVVSGACGDPATASARLTVNTPTSADGPVSQTVCPGAALSLSTAAHGTGPFSYQWIKDGKPLPGATTSSWSIPNATVLDEGTYVVTIAGTCNAVTNTATLTVNPPTTATPLADQTLCFGDTATFSTTPAGTGPFTFIWKKNGLLLADQSRDSLVIAHLKAADAGTYAVEVSGLCSSVTNSAKLAVESIGLVSPATFANPTPIALADFSSATPYPSAINVSCVPGPITQLTVTVTNLSHTYAADIDILLVGPAGQAVMLMSDVGGGNPINNATIDFSDAAAGLLPQSAPVVTGAYQPTNYSPEDLMPVPAPLGPYAASLAAFNGTDANGTWSLYVVDDALSDIGTIADGWSLTLAWDSGTQPIQLSGPAILSDGSPQVTLKAQSGKTYIIEASTDLQTWTPILTNTMNGPVWDFVDLKDSTVPRRFYRAVASP
jgi:uncharacterized repeat protein (TIGR01451 family)